MAERDRISQFDGLRALAFLAVFLHHAIHAPLLWMGVDQFFVLSGFLITRNLLELRDTATSGSALAAFFYRRLLRIVPPYYVALTAILIITPIAASDVPWFYGFASNVRDAIQDAPIEGPLNPMWSIAVEEQFYLLWPWLVLFLPRARLGHVFVAVIVAAPICRLLFANVGFHAVYRLMPCRMDLLAAGALLAVIERGAPGWLAERKRHFIVAALGAVAVFATLTVAFKTFRTSNNDRLFDVAGFGLAAVFFTSALAYVRATDDGPVAAILRHPVLRYVGKISYMAYLLHMLAIYLAAKLHLGTYPTAAIALALTIGLSSLSWYTMELPLQRLRHVVSPRRTPALREAA